MSVLTVGRKGPEVMRLQRDLVKLGYNPGAADGDYGAKTKAAVLAFQFDYTDVDDDGVAGPQTLGKIRQVLRSVEPIEIVRCNDETWKATEKLVDTLRDVRYGPGRGFWHDGKLVVTHGPGGMGLKTWAHHKKSPEPEGAVLPASYASFHCTSLTNFFLGWLTRRNEQYTHAGNIPDLNVLLEQDATLHANPKGGPYRGYGDVCAKIVPDGSAIKRNGVPKILDMREIYDRRDELASFIICGQSTRDRTKPTGYRWWHHTLVIMIRHGRLYRWAADGWRDANGYSGNRLSFREVTEKDLRAYDGVIYEGYGVDTLDGSYGDQAKPIASVVLEE